MSRVEQLWKKLHANALQVSPRQPIGSDPATHHDLLAMSHHLCGATDARSLYATHCALCADQTYFYRLKTRPPTYHVREAAEVERMLKQRAFVRAPALLCLLRRSPLQWSYRRGRRGA